MTILLCYIHRVRGYISGKTPCFILFIAMTSAQVEHQHAHTVSVSASRPPGPHRPVLNTDSKYLTVTVQYNP